MHNIKQPTFSISYFGTYPAEYASNKYELLFKSAQFADENGFEALWIPERHFHPFGGFSPNPSILAGALSRVTKNVKLRAGSVVLPLHHPVRIVEEWSVIDNCSNGRVGMAFASGWHPNDFILTPNNYANRKEDMFSSIDKVRALWKGETLSFSDTTGKLIDISVHPRPLQKELPIWVAVLGNPESYIKAGELGAGILTNLIVQNTSQLQEGIKIYKEALKSKGFSEEDAKIVVLLHTFIGEDKDKAIKIARQPLYDYLSSSMQLFQKTHADQGNATNLDTLSDEDKEFVFNRAYSRYIKGHALIGDVNSCFPTLLNLAEIGVTEFAAFIDFGVSPELVYTNLKHISSLKDQFAEHYNSKRSNPISNFTLKTDEFQQYTSSHCQGFFSGARLDLEGNFNEEVFVKALSKIAQRHEILKTVFSNNGTHQAIEIMPLIEFKSHDLMEYKGDNLLVKVDEYLSKEREIPFNLEKGPLLRIAVIKTHFDHHVISLIAHPLICDEGSLVCIVKEIEAQYNALLKGDQPHLKEVIQYRDYIEAKKNRITEQQSREDDLFWKEVLQSIAIDINDFKTISQTKENKGKQDIEKIEIPKDIWANICKSAINQKCTPFMLLFSAYALLLHKSYKQEELLIVTPTGNRKALGDLSLVGNITYELPIRSKLTPQEDILQRTKNNLSEVFEHYNYSPAKLQILLANVEVLMPCFGFEMNRLPLLSFENLETKFEPLRVLPAHKLLGLNIVEKGTKRYAYWNYHLCFDSKKSIKDYHEYFLNVLATF